MRLQDLLRTSSSRLLDADEAGRLLLQRDDGGTFQLFEWEEGELTRLTDFEEPVGGRYLPGGRRVVLEMDHGGNERHQLYLADASSPPGASPDSLVPLTDRPEVVHRLVGVDPDGGQLAFLSNGRNGVDFDAYLKDLASGEVTCLYDRGGWCQRASGFSPDGRYLSLLVPGPRPLDTDLLLVDTRSGETRTVLPHPEEAALVGPPAWLGPERFLVAANVGRDLQALYLCELGGGAPELVLERPFDLDCFASRDGSRVVVVGNEDGRSRLELLEGGTLRSLGELALPEEGVVLSPRLPGVVLVGPDRVLYTLSSPRLPGEVFAQDLASGAVSRLTESPSRAPFEGLVTPERHRVASFDGEEIPLFLYRPAPAGGRSTSTARGGPAPVAPTGPAPVVVFVHGGPESQSSLEFNAVVQGLVSSGLAVVVPNVRGSTGYGKRYAALDDTTRRLDSVADLGAVHDWLEGAGLDPGRAVLWGGSYGGYMVLAGCAFQPDRWAAGVDIVGISDLVTFLEHTSAYRRSHREREYGSLEDDREFLAAASPLRRVEEIRAPLFVIHGANDPRVPLSEAEQLVASLRRRQVPCELLVYPDEGHGLARLANRLDAYPKAAAFLRTVLGLGPTETGTPA